MQPIPSKHASERMAQRAISWQEIEDVISNHHTEYPDKKGNRILIGNPGGRRIKVVLKKDSNPPFIITVAD